MTYIIKPISYVLVIAMGCLLRHLGFFARDDHRLLSKIMINITLPCAIIQGFAGFVRDPKLFWIVAVGFLCAFLPMLLMYLGTRGVETRLRAYRMLNIGGYNVGCFSLPLIEAFFSGTGVVAACMFDIGNAVMMTGGSYAMTSTLLGTGGETRESARELLIKFFKSVPFDTYMVLFAMMALDIEIPQIVFDMTRPAGQANAFIAMLMIGMMLRPVGNPAQAKEIAREIGLRTAFAAVSASVCYFLLPYDLVTRQALAVLCFAPLSSLAPIYTDRCHADGALASLTNSASIAVSLVCMIALSMFFVM